MDELTGWGHQHATDRQRNLRARNLLDHAWNATRPQLVHTLETFWKQGVSPTALYQFEIALLLLVREFGRLVIQATIQTLEPTEPRAMPKELYFQCGGYRRRSDRTANRSIATRFGNVTLVRTGYRSWQRGEETIFPLELMLGLVENVSPAMLDWIGQATAAAGMSQQATLLAIKQS